MVNYENAKIYKIVCNSTGLVYIGSTTEPTLAHRLSKHIANYKFWLRDNSRNYTSSFRCLENNNYEMVLIESYCCNNKDELHRRERYWTEKYNCVNKIKKQGLKNELGLAEYNKQYRLNNIEKIKARIQTRTECFCGGCYTIQHKNRHFKSERHQKHLQQVEQNQNENNI